MLAFGAILALGSLATDPTPALAAAKKVVIVVGPTGSQTADFRSDARRYASYARSYGARVIEIYSPYATWTKVRNAAQGANILIYLGHGNGYPSPYGSFQRYTKDGFGLNRTSGNGNNNVKYWGEYYIDRDIQMARNAVVILARLCYASGNSERGRAEPNEVDRHQARRQLRCGLPAGRCEGRVRRGHHRRPLHHQEPVHVEPQHARDLLRLPQQDDVVPVQLRVEPNVVGHRLDGSVQAESLLPLGRRKAAGDRRPVARLLTLLLHETAKKPGRLAGLLACWGGQAGRPLSGGTGRGCGLGVAVFNSTSTWRMNPRSVGWRRGPVVPSGKVRIIGRTPCAR